MKLYVTRHGKTIINICERVNSINSIGINKEGRMQAKKAGEQIKNMDIDLIICSPLRRTRQTCSILNVNNVEVVYDDRIVERKANSMQYAKVKNIDVLYWYDLSHNVIYKNTEGFGALTKRVKDFIEDIKMKYEGNNILIVTHGDFCKAVYSYLKKVYDPKKISEFYQDNCEIVEYDI